MKEISFPGTDEFNPSFCPTDPNKINGGEVQNFVQKKNLAQVKIIMLKYLKTCDYLKKVDRKLTPIF